VSAEAAEAPGGAGERPAKAATAFRTISEVAEELDVAQHVLRFWESKFPIVRPLKRGGGRRYYRPEDVEVLRRIRRLLYEEGYTIKGAQKVLRAGRPAGRGGRAADPRPENGAPELGLQLGGVARHRLLQIRAELEDLRGLLRRALG
jgi:DNA-binding transcriptional MerR regulator